MIVRPPVMNRFLAFFTSLFLFQASLCFAQTPTRPNRHTDKAAAWQDDELEVRVAKPFISKPSDLQETCYLVLQYVVTNKTGTDLVINREGQAEIGSDDQEVKLFRRFKKSGTYDEIRKNDYSVSFSRTSLPADMPVRTVISFLLPHQSTSWWTSKKQITSEQAVDQVLSGVDALVILIPSRRLRMVLPVNP